MIFIYHPLANSLEHTKLTEKAYLKVSGNSFFVSFVLFVMKKFFTSSTSP
jgi:hypothetical protein